MTYEQAERLVERLKNACTFHRFEEPGVNAEYIRFLMKYDHDRMSEAIDTAIEEDSRNVPAISVLAKKYREVKEGPKGKISFQNEKYCPTCHDRGFVLLKEQVKTGEDGKGNPVYEVYEFLYYCPFCNAGKQYRYDGQQCKSDYKSNYRIPPIMEVLPEDVLNNMRKENLKKKWQNEQSRAERKIRDLRSVTANIGKDIPEVRHYDDEFVPGDAYEEEELPV